MKNIFKVNGKFNIVSFIILMAIPIGGGIIVGTITKGSRPIYESLIKGPFFPPPWIFGVAWTVLYILMGFASYRAFMRLKEDKKSYFELSPYFIQLILNFLWPILFFNFRLYGLAAIEIIILLMFIVITTIKFFKIDKFSGILFVPYLIWTLYATYLNIVIWILNEM